MQNDYDFRFQMTSYIVQAMTGKPLKKKKPKQSISVSEGLDILIKQQQDREKSM